MTEHTWPPNTGSRWSSNCADGQSSINHSLVHTEIFVSRLRSRGSARDWVFYYVLFVYLFLFWIFFTCGHLVCVSIVSRSIRVPLFGSCCLLLCFFLLLESLKVSDSFSDIDFMLRCKFALFILLGL